MPNKFKNIIFISLTALLTVLICFIYSRFKLELVDVPISKYTLANRTCITLEDIEYMKIPKAYISENIYLDIEDILNKYVSINAKVFKGSFFYKDVIEDMNLQKDSFFSKLNKNEAAYNLFVSDVKVNDASLKEGMAVDIYLTLSKDRVVSDLLISKAMIIGLYDNNGSQIKDYETSKKINCITVSIPENTISILNKARLAGELSLIVTYDTYSDSECKLNKNSILMEYLS